MIKVIKDCNIEELDFSVRTYNCIKRAGINTVQDIADKWERLPEVRNLGRVSLAEIKEKVKPYIEDINNIHTNYDRIRAMSVEEVSKGIQLLCKRMMWCEYCPMYGNCADSENIDDIKKWLLQEVSENDR